MLITGCHRSGTSLLASIVSDVIDNERTNDLPPLIDNPTGYFESVALRELNDQLLMELGYRWDQPPLHPIEWCTGYRMQLLIQARQRYGNSKAKELWVDKDPRLCITFGAFEHILLKRVPIAISLRDPNEVATSLHRRDGLKMEHGYLIWYLYNRSISLHLRQGDLVVLYEELIESRQSNIQNTSVLELELWIENQLGSSYKSQTFQSILSKRIKPVLRRSNPSQFNQHTAHNTHDWATLADHCRAIYATLRRSKDPGTRIARMNKELSTIPANVINCYESIMLMGEPDLEHLRNVPDEWELQQSKSKSVLINENQRLINELHEIRTSTSWRVMQPFRSILDTIKRMPRL